MEIVFMKKSIGLWQFFGYAVTALVGTLLHFSYDWLGGALWVAPFSGVNESTWEHMKLFFWPAFLFAVVQSFFFRDRKDFLMIKLRGILSGLILIPVLFYTYNGVIGKSPDWINISIFFIASAIAFIYEYRLLRADEKSDASSKIPLVSLLIIAATFVIFTFFTPTLGIFRDPIGNTYGII